MGFLATDWGTLQNSVLGAIHFSTRSLSVTRFGFHAMQPSSHLANTISNPNLLALFSRVWQRIPLCRLNLGGTLRSLGLGCFSSCYRLADCKGWLTTDCQCLGLLSAFIRRRHCDRSSRSLPKRTASLSHCPVRSLASWSARNCWRNLSDQLHACSEPVQIRPRGLQNRLGATRSNPLESTPMCPRGYRPPWRDSRGDYSFRAKLLEKRAFRTTLCPSVAAEAFRSVPRSRRLPYRLGLLPRSESRRNGHGRPHRGSSGALRPGFRDLILARSTRSPAQLERENPNLVGGNITGGANSLGQLFIRPMYRLYTTPVKGLFLCSASTPPGAGVHGMCGYHAAM